MSLARKILSNTFIQFGGKLITAALSIVILKMITNYLGATGYGNYTTIYNFLAFFGIAADFGIFTITVKEMSKEKSDVSMILGNALGLRTILALLSMALAVLVAFLIPKYGNTVIPLGVAIATVSTLLNLLNGTVSSVLQVHLKMHYETIALVAGKLVSLAYMGLVIYAWFTGDITQGFYHLLWAGALGNGIMLAITSFYTRRYSSIKYRFDFVFWKQLFLTSLPYGVALVLSNVYLRLDILLMGWMLPQSTSLADGSIQCSYDLCGDAQVGLYGVAMRFLEMLIIIPVYFMNAVLPIMTRYIEQSRERLKKLIQYSFDFLSATGLPIMAGSILLAVPIIKLVADPEFLGGGIYTFGSETAIRILMFAMLFSFLSNLFGFTLVGLNKQKILMWVNLGGVLLNLGTNLFVIPRWGFVGAASTSVLSEILVLGLTSHFALKALDMKINFKTSGKALLSTGVMGIVVGGGYLLLKDFYFVFQLGILVPLGGAVYLAMMWSTKAVTSEMWDILRKK